MLAKTFAVRNISAGRLADRFIVSAVASILIIRLYLELTGYPQLGGGGLHIAHMLWGGLLMLVAIIILLSFLTAGALRLAAVLGGIGFGTFIDELGKFITSDNNYFFQPTVSLIYVLFILLYLAIQYIERHRPFSEAEYLVNSLDALKEAIVEDLDVEEERRARSYLASCDARNPLVPAIGGILDEVQCSPPPPPSRWTAPVRWVRDWYPKLVAWRWFPVVLLGFFTIEALGAIVQSSLLTFAAAGWLPGVPGAALAPVSFTELGDVVFSLVSGVFVIAGVVRFRRSRLAAYRLFRIAVLISILLIQFFQFYDIQLRALVGFTIDWVTFVLLTHLIEREESLQRAAALQPTSAAPAPTLAR